MAGNMRNILFMLSFFLEPASLTEENMGLRLKMFAERRCLEGFLGEVKFARLNMLGNITGAHLKQEK